MKKKRKKLTKRQRSAAAKKGWETRRRNKRKMPKPVVKPKKGFVKEYALKFDYKTKRKGHVIDVEVHMWGPVATKQEVRQVYEHWYSTGETEKGWRIKVIKWRHGTNQRWSESKATEAKKKELDFALGSEPTGISGL